MLNASFERQACALRLVLLQRKLAQASKELDVQDSQHALDVLHPAFGFGLIEQPVLGGANDLGVEILEHEAAFLGLCFGHDLPRSIAHLDRFALGQLGLQRLHSRTQFVIALVQRPQALA